MHPAVKTKPSIASDFRKRYRIEIAHSEGQQAECFALRRKVFCDEFGYAMHQSHGLESDPYDKHSIHILLRSSEDGVAVGCYRLVVAQPERADWLPFHHYGVPHIPASYNWSAINRAASAEVSRLALDPTARGNRAHSSADTPADSYLVASLFYSMSALLMHHKLQHVFMVIEPRLARLTARYGVQMEQLSDPFEYFGSRAAFIVEGDRIQLDNPGLKPQMRDLLHVVQGQVLEQVDIAKQSAA